MVSFGVWISGIGGIKNLQKYDTFKYHFNTPYAFSILGACVFGFGFGFITIPVLPEIMEGVEEKYGDTYNVKIFTDNMSGYFIVSQAMGEFLGPMLCEIAKKKMHFRPA